MTSKAFSRLASGFSQWQWANTSTHTRLTTRETRGRFGRSVREFVRVTRLVDLMKPGTVESLYGNGELILVIDDEPNTPLMTRAILEDRNYRVVCANGGMEALAMFAAFSEEMSTVRVVLTGIDLSDMKGVALIQEIKKLEKDTLFIVSIGQDELVPVSELRALGITNFVAKPYDPLKLLKTLRQVLEH